MKQIAMLMVALICASGCMRYIISEPLPAILPVELSVADLPAAPTAAIRRHEPDAVVLKARGWEFKRKITFYDVTIQTAEGVKTYDVSADGTQCRLKQEEETPNQKMHGTQ